jgi:hypothetical protein
MARRNPSAKWVLPEVVDPPDRICFKVMVPNERFHIAAFRGALFMLSSAIYWSDDLAHTAKEVALVWREIWDNIVPGCDCPILPVEGLEVEEEMSLHVDCDCNVTVDCCDGSKVQLATVAMLNSTPATNPPPQPAPGDCSTVTDVLQANQKFLYFAGVGGGDVITMTDISGATNDGGTLNWYCPDGHYYGAGHCGTLGQHTDSGDPCPSLFHMQLIATDSLGNCYDATTNFTINSGVPDGSLLTFQVNDSDLSNNSGSVAFTAKICKNALPQTFYYINTDNTYAEGGHPVCADLHYTALPVGVSTTFTSLPPGDSVNPSNPQALTFITFSSAQAPTTCLWTNTGNIGYKVTALNVIGATWSSGSGPYHWTEEGSDCHSTGASFDTNVLPTLPVNLNFFEVRSLTQFTIMITIEPCS